MVSGTDVAVAVLRSAIFSVLLGLISGVLVVVVVLSLEGLVAYYAVPSLVNAKNLPGPMAGIPALLSRLPELVPATDSEVSMAAFPRLAAQISASLLGFYLASVSIVLGTSYRDVSADVRALVLGSATAKLYMRSIAVAIGAGLALVLLESLGVLFGYLTVSVYVLVVAFSAWAFARLTFGAFNLFNPLLLSNEPLRNLYRAINRIGTRGVGREEAVLRAVSFEADNALRILAELITLTSDRASVNRMSLARTIEALLAQVRFYAGRKHLLEPENAWFIRDPVYPKWVETDAWAVSNALTTSTPLWPRLEPVVDWLERRSAELAAAALDACVMADDRATALRINNAVAMTARTLANYSRLDDAIAFSRTVSDRCGTFKNDNTTAVVVVSAPPYILSSLLLGVRAAIFEWPTEIRKVVSETKWDNRNTTVVHIKGESRARSVAQRLLEEVQAEHDIEGKRLTPDWYLELALADACILALRELADKLTELIGEFAGTLAAESPAPLRATAGAQALQAIAKAELVAVALPEAVQGLETLRMGGDRQESDEFGGLVQAVRATRGPILDQIAEALLVLPPEQPASEPDLFGEAFFTLVHQTEDAIEKGGVEVVTSVFPKLLRATPIFERHLLSTYRPPTYRSSSLVFDPTMDLLELSGLAIVYGVLREDSSADTIRQAWRSYIQSCPQPEGTAKRVLSVLDEVDGKFNWGISRRSFAWNEWNSRLAKRIVEAGYASPDEFAGSARRLSNAPLLIEMLGTSRSLRSFSVRPRALFAAEVIGPLSGESETELRERGGLRHYYERLELLERRTAMGNDGPIDDASRRERG